MDGDQHVGAVGGDQVAVDVADFDGQGRQGMAGGVMGGVLGDDQFGWPPPG